MPKEIFITMPGHTRDRAKRKAFLSANAINGTLNFSLFKLCMCTIFVTTKVIATHTQTPKSIKLMLIIHKSHGNANHNAFSSFVYVKKIKQQQIFFLAISRIEKENISVCFFFFFSWLRCQNKPTLI